VLEERQRLSRELHGCVTQSVYRIALCAEAAARALIDGDSDPVATNLPRGEYVALHHVLDSPPHPCNEWPGPSQTSGRRHDVHRADADRHSS
jgi:hypothetical protein